jgi:hypothetical protein
MRKHLLAPMLQWNFATSRTVWLIITEALPQNKGVFMSFKPFEKVNWLAVEQLPSGFTCSVSEKSGIMKVQFPNSFHQIMVYRDQVQELGLSHPEILAYVERTTAIRNSGDNKAAKAISKDKQKLVDGIVNNKALTEEQKQAMLKLIA